MKKIISLILVIVSLFSFTACQEPVNDPNSGKKPSKVDQVITSNFILKNGLTDYKIVISDDAGQDETTAKDELVSLFLEATGIKLEVIYDEGLTHSASNKYFSIGKNELFDSANIQIEEGTKIKNAYQITTKDSTIYFYGNQKLGHRYAMYDFLYRTLNFEQYSYDCYWIDKAVTEIPLYKYTIVDGPDFYNYQAFAGFMTNNDGARIRMYASEKYGSLTGRIYGQQGHLALDYVKGDPELNLEVRDEWLAYPDKTQVCYMAQGNEESRKDLVERYATSIIDNYKNQLDKTIWSIDGEDNASCCNCEVCSNLRKKYGCNTAQMIWFINDVNAYIQAWFKTEEGKPYYNPEFHLRGHFYEAYTDAPAKFNEETGEWEPIDETVVFDEGIMSNCAPIRAYFQYSYHDEVNTMYYNILRKIAACSNEMSLWVYSTNFHSYLYPYDLFNTLQESYQIYYNDFKVRTMLDETQNGNYLGLPSWHMLSAALSAKLANDIYLDQEAYIQRYFRGYFLDAADVMMQYFKSFRNFTLLQLNGLCPGMGQIYYNIREKEYWPKSIIDKWQGYVEEAMQIIEKYKYTDPETYDMLYKHISLERVFLDYCYIHYYKSNVGSDYSKYFERFKYDCILNKISLTAEGSQNSLEKLLSSMSK